MAPAPPLTGGERDYYEVLGVRFDSPEEEIRRKYHSIVRTLHPDRGASSALLEPFYQVQAAWRCLSDPTRRLLYDLRNFGSSSLNRGDSDNAEDLLISRQKEQARLDLSNMEVELDKILRRERKAKGVLMCLALYGNLRLKEDRLELCVPGVRTIEASDLEGPVIDVTMPLQCLVERHSLVLPGGSRLSKSDLPGFYNPTPLDTDVELSLYVLYEFKGMLHEVIVGDTEPLSLPLRRHLVQVPRGPFSPANVMLLRRRPGWQPAAPNVSVSERSPRGAARSTAASPASVASPARAQRAAAAKVAAWFNTNPEEALANAARSFVLLGIHGEEGEVTVKEFTAVVLFASAFLGLAVLRVCSGKRQR